MSASPAAAQRTFARFRQKTDFSSMVVVVVGSEKKEYFVHRDLLVSQSSFFRAALDSEALWKEAAEGRVVLPEADSKSFDLFLGWLYFGQLPVAEHEDDYGKTTAHDHSEVLVGAYLLGNKLQAPAFKNALVDALITLTEAENIVLGIQLTYRIYEETAPEDKIGKLAADLYAWDGKDEAFDKACEDIHPEFSHDVVKTLMRWREGRGQADDAPYQVDRCVYHEHSEKHPECIKKSSEEEESEEQESDKGE